MKGSEYLMDYRTVATFRKILRGSITGTPVYLPEDIDRYIHDVLSLAQKQDVYMLVCCGIRENHGVLPEESEKERIKEVYRFSQNEYVLNTTKRVLSESKIPHVPLKGAIIKELYPEKWMRGSCDVDILVKEADLEKAVDALVKAGFETKNRREYHDISLYYGGAHLELHFNICENIQRIDRVLSHVWENVTQVSEYEYHEIPGFFAFHMIAHMLYHFLRGGCNIKQFVDLWLLRKNHYYEEKDVRPFLKKCRLERFYDVICEVTDALFGEKESTELTKEIENQVLQGGIIGRRDHSDAISVFVNGGKIQYYLRAAFLPIREMEGYYPVLRKWPVLLPIYYCRRVFSKTLGVEKDRAQKLLKIDTKNHHGQQSEMLNLLSKMGLK